MGIPTSEDRKWPWIFPVALALIVMPIASVSIAIMVIRAWPEAVDGAFLPLSNDVKVQDVGSVPQDFCQPQKAGRFSVLPYEIKGPVRWEEVPSTMKHDYTLGGKVQVIQAYFGLDDKTAPSRPKTPSSFNQSYIQHLVDAAKLGFNVCHYKCSKLFSEAFKEFPVKGKKVVILGSMLPWAEAHCLAAEAGSITTVDYNNPNFEYPGLRFWSPQELSESKELFDAAISYSSFEHDGLGRYGDPLHPFADFHRMRQLRNLLKPDGKLFVGVPVGNDTLVFNWHRIYGKIRFPKFIEGWKLLKTFGVSLEEKWRTNVHAEYHWQPLNVLEIDQHWVPTPITI